jgi:hypothetical protein
MADYAAIPSNAALMQKKEKKDSAPVKGNRARFVMARRRRRAMAE